MFGAAMGVTYVAQWNMEEGKNYQQTLEDLQTTIEKLGATKSGLYHVECDSFQATTANQGKALNIITNSEYPLSRFSHFEEGPTLISDGMLPNFISKLRMFWQQRKGAKIECKGHRYILNDFCIKVGVVSHGSNTRGIALEVEYTPCIYAKECWNLMLELLQSIMGNQVPTSEPPILQSMKSTDVYTPEHTSQQYIELFNACRKIT